MSILRNTWLLMWKNWVRHKRNKCETAVEIIMPVFFGGIFLLIRFMTKKKEYDDYSVYPYRPIEAPAKPPQTWNSYDTQYIGYYPATPISNMLMSNFLNTFKQSTNWTSNVQTIGFNTEKAMEDAYLNGNGNTPLNFHFHTLDNKTSGMPSNMTYTIRPETEGDDTWNTHSTFNGRYGPSINQTRGWNGKESLYRRRGLLYFIWLLDKTIIEAWSNTTLTGVDVNTRRMPYPPYIIDPMIDTLKNGFPIFILLSFVVSIIMFTKTIVYEKETKLKESMKLVGVSPASYWLSWLLSMLIYVLVVMVIYTAVVAGVKSLPKTDPSVFLVFMIIYGVSMVTFAFMVSVFVQKANVAAVVAGIGFILFFVPKFVFTQDLRDVPYSSRMATSILFNTAMSWGAVALSYLEEAGVGGQWSNINEKPAIDQEYTVLHSWLMMLLDAGIHLLITWYVDHVYPGTYGVPKPFYFPFTRSFWCGAPTKENKRVGLERAISTHYEREPDLSAGISIMGLSKSFGGKEAVSKMTLNMYEDQITVLLGHNGAGKTTTMSMLTGFIPPSSGTAIVSGYDIRTNIDNVRENMGLCPQHNILFDQMTVEEHLWFYAKMKSYKGDINAAVNQMINDTGLAGKQWTQSRFLSGGQKRKLSVGIAILSGAKIVVLDEPSSGMDPAARRGIWTVLQRYKKGRTILLTTHYMDEADVLGDRIAIMAEGVVKCCGSSMFLKKLYGAGYRLIVVKTPRCEARRVAEFVASIIPTSELEDEIGSELVFTLPDQESSKFPKLFRALEQQKGELGLDGFGTSATTMEEVFLRVGDSMAEGASLSEISTEIDIDSNTFQNKAFKKGSTDSLQNVLSKQKNGAEGHLHGRHGMVEATLDYNKGFVKKTGTTLRLAQFRGLFVKKTLSSLRTWMISVLQLALPIAFTIGALLVVNNIPDTKTPIRVDFSLSEFNDPIFTVSNGTNPNSKTDQLEKITEKFFKLNKLATVEKINRNKYENITDYYIAKVGDLGNRKFSRNYIIGADYQSDGVGVNATAYFNDKPFHAEPTALASLMQIVMYSVKNMPDKNILATSLLPMPKKEDKQRKDNVARSMMLGWILSIFMSMGISFLTSGFVYLILQERKTGSKHLQTVSGVSPAMYWLPSFLWDYINYLVPMIAVMIVFAAFDEQAFVGDNAGGPLLLIILYGFAILPFVYLFQMLFQSPPTGFVATLCLAFFLGFFTTMVIFIVTPQSEAAGDALRIVFAIMSPYYIISGGFMDMYMNNYNKETCKKMGYPDICTVQPDFICCRGTCKNCLPWEPDVLSFDTPGIGQYLLILFFQGVVYIILIMAIEYRLFQKLRYFLRKPDAPSASTLMVVNNTLVATEDSDVAMERDRIYKNEANNTLFKTDSLILTNLTKQFGNFLAVDHLCVGVPQEECFGLLGQNGAGKTTTFKMLTGMEMASAGNAYVLSYDIKNNIKKVQANMGYCPQFDAVSDMLTGWETLRLYARIKGIPEDHIDRVAGCLVDLLGFRPHANKLVGAYSGGNKRKLSTALALIGDPAFILLDEPSSGMDPAARRQLWNVLSQVRSSGRTLVLTSHSMEECDALCTRIAIMVNGRFVCLGSPQHLKNKFGQGYTLVAQMDVVENGSYAPEQPLVQYVQQNIPSTKVFDSHQGYVHLHVPDPSVKLADLFTIMENAKASLNIRDYTVHQTTLEQVFLGFTRTQVVRSAEKKPGRCSKCCCCCCRRDSKVADED